MNNPFTAGSMIMNPDEFFGRKRELYYIFNRLQTQQSTSVVGERRIGKSSLLYYLYQKGQSQLGETYRFVYVDLQEVENHINVQHLFANILNELGVKFEAQETIGQNLIEFSTIVKKLEKEGTKVVLLFDECEELIQHRHEFPEDFFDQMRALLNKRKMLMVASSKTSLKTLSLEGKLSSPFYNVLGRLDLKEFTEPEAAEFIIAERGIEPFSYDEMEFIVSYPQWCHPLILQIVCYHVVENRVNHLITGDLEKAIKADAENYFAEGIINYTRRKKGTVLKILSKIATVAEELGKPIIIKKLGG